jgi:putative phage associated protein
MRSETCYHCLHADFKAESEGAMRGFAKCTKARNPEERSKYYFGGYECDKGKFEAAPAATMAKRSEIFEKWRTKGNNE